MSTPRKIDDELERLLGEDGGEIGSLYRRLPRMEPPRRLDRAVLGEAARAVHGRPPRRQRWLVGFGSAAGIVLAAGIAWHVGQDALRQQAHDAARGNPSFVPVQPIDGSAHDRREQTAPPIETEAAPASAPPAAPMASDQAHSANTQRVTKPPASPRPAARAPALPPAPPPPAKTTAPASFPDAQEPAAHEAEEAARPAEVKAEAGSAAAAASEKVGAARARSPAAPAPSASVELRRDMQLAPENWLAHIQQLLRQGRRQQAIESLRLFRRAHPDWQLSDELRALSD